MNECCSLANQIINENSLTLNRKRRNAVIEFDSSSASPPRMRRPVKYHQNLVHVPQPSVANAEEFDNTLNINFEAPPEAQFQQGIIPLGAPCYQLASTCPTGAACAQGLCQCSDNYVQAGALCIARDRSEFILLRLNSYLITVFRISCF